MSFDIALNPIGEFRFPQRTNFGHVLQELGALAAGQNG
jgi:DNA-directed RNA polymerase beta subunit